MLAEIYPLQVLLMTFSGLVNRHQADVIAYLVEENRVLEEQTRRRSGFLRPPAQIGSFETPQVLAQARVGGRR